MKSKALKLLVVAALLATLCMAGLVACADAEFKLNFVVDGNIYSTVNTAGEETIKLPDNPQKEGYIFDGWYWDDGIWARPFTAESLLNEKLEADMSVYAKWLEEDITKRTFKVTYNSMSGSAVADSSVLYNTLITKPADPTRTGYVFVGWYKEADCTTAWNFAQDTVTANITLYAKWVSESDASGCDVLEAEGFTVSDTTLSMEVVNATETFALSSAITVSPYASWTVSTDIAGAEVIPSATVTLSVGDNTFYINVTSGTQSNKKQYTVNIRRHEIYNVTFSFGNGQEDVIVPVEEDSLVTEQTATRTGYTYSGWTYDSESWDFASDVVTSNMTLTASWTPNVYNVTFDSAGGGEIAAATATYDATFTFAVPTRAGYTFTGWKLSDGTAITDAAGAGTGLWNQAQDTTLTAGWSAVTYNITYNDVDGGTNTNPASYTVEDADITLADASKTGYTFLGWYSDSALTTAVTVIDTAGCADVQLWAKWEAIIYTATFQNADGVVGTVEFTVEDTSLAEPAVPEKAGYTATWAAYTISASNLTINAVYTPITYNITYTNTKSAANSNPATYNIETPTITLAALSVPGYTFEGWFSGDTQVTSIDLGSMGDISLEARWSIITYNITYVYDDTMGNLAEGDSLVATYTVEQEFDFTALVCHAIGYNFAGWFTEKDLGTGSQVTGIALGSTGDMTVYAQWGLEVYDITYMNTEGAVNTNPATYTIESEQITLAEVSKTGYAFEGWFTDADLTTAADTEIETGSHGDLTFYAKWSIVGYEIVYNLYNGTYEEGVSNPSVYTIEQEVVLSDPILEGSYFAGWYDLAEGGNLVTSIPVGSSGNRTLYARWITFNSNGGSAIEYDMSYSASGVTAPDNPVKDYYDFSGWYLDSGFNTAYDFTLPTGSCTLYAKWTPTEYEIVYVMDGGVNNASNPATYNIEESVTYAAPTKTGYLFNGWYSEADMLNLTTGIPVGSHGTVTVWASFSIEQYTISFESNGGTSVAEITQNYGTQVTRPSDPAKTGYAFAGWYSDSALTSVYSFTTIPAQDITLYAKWTLVTYNIIYNLDGGTNAASNPATFTYESADIQLAAPSKTGYEFTGWCLDSSLETSITQIAAGSYGNKELFASWQAVEYAITYVVPDGTENTNIQVYTIETAATELIAPELPGYTFDGWYTSSDYATSITSVGGGSVGALSIYGKFTANVYDVWMDGSAEATSTVTFNLNGAEGTAPAAQTVSEATPLTYPAIPEREGYMFGGWYANASCTGTPYDFSALVGESVTLYAKWVQPESGQVINMNTPVSVQLTGTQEQVYSFIPLVSGNVSITTTGTIDTLGSIYSGEELLKQNDDRSSSDKNFLITYNVTAGQVYDIYVRAFSADTSATVTLSLTGETEVADGGVSAAGTKASVTYGSSFTMPVPQGEALKKFLGWQDVNGTMYTDEHGNSVRNWDIPANTTLFSKWEKMEYTVTFNTSGGSDVDSVTLEYGARLNVNDYVTTRSGYSFLGWYLNASDAQPYNASTMPDHDIALIAKWTTYSLGGVKYDESKKAISINNTLNAELFNALCIDTDGKPVSVAAAIASGTFEAGQTITVYLSASVAGFTPAVATVEGVKVYGAPTVEVTVTDKDYINPDEFTAAVWGASGVDTFGEPTQIVVRLAEGYGAGDVTSVYVDSIDPAGNVTTHEVENVSVYALPEIVVADTDVRYDEDMTVDSLGISVTDSFGQAVTDNITLSVGGMSAENPLTFQTTTSYRYDYFTATESGTAYLYHKNGSSGDRTYRLVYCVTTDTIIVSNSYCTHTNYDYASFNVTEGYEYYVRTYAYSSSYTTQFSMYLTGSAIFVNAEIDVTITATDSKGNTSVSVVPVKVYRPPVISDAEQLEFSVGDEITVDAMGLTAVDGFEGQVEVSIAVVEGEQTASSVMTYRATAVDVAGNATTKDFEVKIYGTPQITYDKAGLTVDENPTFDEIVVTFDLNGASGTAPAAQIVTDTVGLEYPENPTRSGYVFAGWYTDSACNGTAYDFTATGTSSITLYAKWVSHTGNATALEYNGSGWTVSVIGQNNSVREQDYYAFVPLVSGNVTIYSTGSMDSYGYLYDGNKSLLTSDDDDGDANNFSITYSLTAGELYYIRPTGYQNYSGTVTIYVTGTAPADGGKLYTYTNPLNVVAKDSFGQDLEFTVELAEGTFEVGNYVTYRITATDHLGNTATAYTAQLGVYDVEDIQFTYSAGASNVIKLSSKGEEFFAAATDSFGNACDIEVTQSDGSPLQAGAVQDIILTAYDKAGNVVVSDVIGDVSVYGMPTIEFLNDSYYVEATDVIEYMFRGIDSFGNQVYADVQATDMGDYYAVEVSVTDTAGNTTEGSYNVEKRY